MIWWCYYECFLLESQQGRLNFLRSNIHRSYYISRKINLNAFAMFHLVVTGIITPAEWTLELTIFYASVTGYSTPFKHILSLLSWHEMSRLCLGIKKPVAFIAFEDCTILNFFINCLQMVISFCCLFLSMAWAMPPTNPSLLTRLVTK